MNLVFPKKTETVSRFLGNFTFKTTHMFREINFGVRLTLALWLFSVWFKGQQSHGQSSTNNYDTTGKAGHTIESDLSHIDFNCEPTFPVSEGIYVK